ncbi:MAG: hypothetical protein LBI54_00925, partial [Lachnospiraceae bacterium]|nr:hypothetical protein [Lachnospiraceae bacterium]
PPPIPTASLAEVVGIAGLSFTNAGFEVTDAYTQEAFDGAVTPDAGYKLLVAKYNVTNTTESDIMLDINARGWRVRVGYNGNSSTMTRTLMTLLPNDLAYFADNIAAGETVTLVALVDAAVGSADEVSSVQLSIGTEAGDINITN